MEPQADSNALTIPTASVTVTFLSPEIGGRNTMPNFSEKPLYRPHIVVQDPSIRHATYDDAGMCNEHYMGIEFVAGPDDADFDVPLQCTLRFTYFPRVNYSTAIHGETFTVREGGRIVAYGAFNSVAS